MGNIGPVEFFAFAVLGAWFVGSGKAYAILQALKSAPTTITNPTGNATGVIGAGGTTGTGGDTGGPGGQGTIGSGGGTGPGTTGTGGKTGGMGG